MGRKLRYNDPAGDMAKAQLQKIEMYAAKLNEMIHPDDELESWVQSKLARVATDMGDVKHYLDYEIKKMGHGGKTDEAVNLFHVGFKYEKEGDDDKDYVRIVKVYACCKDEAEKIASEKYGPYYDDFEIVEIEQKQMKHGGEVTASEMLEARSVVGEPVWKTLSRNERNQITEYLINKGWVEEEEDELLGMQPDVDMLELHASQYYKEGGDVEEMDEYEYERTGIEHEMLEYEYKKKSKDNSVPKWFKEMPLNYKKTIVKNMK